jgi:hypothetical protein
MRTLFASGPLTPAQAAVGAELKKYGLRYDDLLDPLQSLVRSRVAREGAPPHPPPRRTWRRPSAACPKRSWTCATSG